MNAISSLSKCFLCFNTENKTKLKTIYGIDNRPLDFIVLTRNFKIQEKKNNKDVYICEVCTDRLSGFKNVLEQFRNGVQKAIDKNSNAFKAPKKQKTNNLVDYTLGSENFINLDTLNVTFGSEKAITTPPETDEAVVAEIAVIPGLEFSLNNIEGPPLSEAGKPNDLVNYTLVNETEDAPKLVDYSVATEYETLVPEKEKMTAPETENVVTLEKEDAKLVDYSINSVASDVILQQNKKNDSIDFQEDLNHTCKDPSETEHNQCTACDKTLQNSSIVSIHVNDVHLRVRKYSCKQCPKKFTKLKEMELHSQSFHQKPRAETFPCKTCGKSFDNMQTLSMHMRNHDAPSTALRPFGCTICGISFKFSESLIAHLSSHDIVTKT